MPFTNEEVDLSVIYLIPPKAFNLLIKNAIPERKSALE
jgi:hypothetical protein